MIFTSRSSNKMTYFPRLFNKTYEKLWVEIYNSDGFVFKQDVEDIMGYELFYTFHLTYPSISLLGGDGEYKVKVFGDGEQISYGLIYIGDGYERSGWDYNSMRRLKEYKS